MYLALGGVNINVRLLDPPLDEYLPKKEEDIADLAKKTGKTIDAVKNRIAELHMTNPMMGLRGCRLDVVYPEIGRMQAKAVITAALRAEETLSKGGKKVHITASIMVPQVIGDKEFKFVKDLVSGVADKIIAESKIDNKLKYIVGTMVETPRAPSLPARSVLKLLTSLMALTILLSSPLVSPETIILLTSTSILITTS